MYLYQRIVRQPSTNVARFVSRQGSSVAIADVVWLLLIPLSLISATIDYSKCRMHHTDAIKLRTRLSVSGLLPVVNLDRTCFAIYPAIRAVRTRKSNGKFLMSTMLEPAFLTAPAITCVSHQKQCDFSRSRVCMTSDQSTKPTNGTPARAPRPEPSTPTRKGTGMAVSIAVADEWNTDVIHQRFRLSSGKIPSKVTRYGPVLHVSCAGVDAFSFPFGCLVIWDGDKDDEEFYKATAGAGSVGLKRTPIVSRTRWVTGDENGIGSDILIEGGTNGLRPVMERLAISYALAQGVKLRALHIFLQDAVKNTKHISEELAQTGHISTSKKEVSKLSGKLFMERFRYHILDDVLEIPDFLLENEEYLPHYRKMERRLEMRERGLALTARFEALQAFYGLLSDEITHHYSIGLELAITIMIAFEIFLSLMALARQSLRRAFSVCAIFLGVSLILWGLWRVCRRRSATSAAQKFGGSSRSWR